MSFTDVLHELPTLTVSEQQLLVRRALELDDAGLSTAEEALVAHRLSEHQQNPGSSVPLDEMKSRLRVRFGG